MAYPQTEFGLWQHIRDLANTGNASTAAYPLTIYGLLQNIRDLVNSGNASTAAYPRTELGLLQNIRDLLNSGNASIAAYTVDVLGVTTNIRDLLNKTSASVASYPAGYYGALQAACDFAAANGIGTPAGPTWDAGTVANVTLSNGNLTATNTGTTSLDQGAHVPSSSGKSSGKYYFELTLTTFTGGTGVALGIGTTASTYTNMSQLSTHGDLVFVSTGNIWSDTNNTGGNVGRALVNGDVLCVAADLTDGRIWFRLGAAGLWNGTVGHDPTLPDGLHGGYPTPAGTLVPFVTFGNGLSGGGASGNVVTANFGGSAFTGAVPSGYTSGWPS